MPRACPVEPHVRRYKASENLLFRPTGPWHRWMRSWHKRSVLARSRTWSSTVAGSRANPPHSKDQQYLARELNPVLRCRKPLC